MKRSLLSALAATCFACTGSIGDLNGNGTRDEDLAPPDFESPTLSPGPQVLLATPRFVRLSHAQWENTIQALFKLTTPVGLSRDFSNDQAYGHYDTDYHRLEVSSGLWGDYQRAAETLAQQQSQSSASSRWLPANLPASGNARRDAFISSFGHDVFRRELTAEERSRYTALFDRGAAAYGSGNAFNDGVRITIEAMLQSPNFVYRDESAGEQVGDTIRLSGNALASRLSYFIWNTMPDEELFAAAESGALEDDAGLTEQVSRMLDDERAKAVFKSFHAQLLDFSKYGDIERDPEAFPNWDKAVMNPAYRTEGELFMQSLVFNGGTLRDILTSKRTFVNADLAEAYGLEGSYNATFQEATLPEGRPGLLTRLGFLAFNAKKAHPDLIHRGLFMSTTLLCRSLAPPPNVDRTSVQSGTTNRERINSVTGPGTCGEGCHGVTINPPGFALESFDATGQFRTMDNGAPVDTTGLYAFANGRTVEFDDITGLVPAIADAPEFHRCYTSHIYEYFYGRGVLAGDMPLVDDLAQQSLDGALDMRGIVTGIATSKGFRYRTASELDAEVSQ